MVVLRSGHHVQKLIASRPNVLKLVFLHFYSSWKTTNIDLF
jgi:hypothetical protein